MTYSLISFQRIIRCMESQVREIWRRCDLDFPRKVVSASPGQPIIVSKLQPS